MLEGKISQIRDTKNLVNILNILGKTQYSPELGAIRIEYTNIQNTTAQIFSDGSFTIRSPTKAIIEQAGLALFQIIIRHNHCTGCRICEQQCSNTAIQIEHNQITINPDRCIQCMECLGYCPLLLNRSFTFT